MKPKFALLQSVLACFPGHFAQYSWYRSVYFVRPPFTASSAYDLVSSPCVEMCWASGWHPVWVPHGGALYLVHGHNRHYYVRNYGGIK